MSQQPHERSHNHSDDSLTPLGHQNPLGVHHGLGQLGLQTKGLAGGSSLSILDPDIFFPNGLPEIDLSNDEVTPAHQSAPSSQSEQSTSTPSFIQPQRTEHSQSRQTAINQSLQQQSRQPTHQLNKQPSNQATNSTSQLQSNPSNVPTIQPSLDNAPDQPPVNQANSAPSPHPIQRILNDQPEIIPQSAQSLEQTQPAAESSSPPTIQAKEITPESNSAELSAPNQAPHLSAKPIQSKPIEAVAKAQSSRKQQSTNPSQKGTEKLTHTDIQRYFDPQPQTLSESSFSDRSVSDSSEQVVQVQSFTDETNSDNSSSPNTELGSAGDAHPTDNLDLGGAIAPAQPFSSAMAQRLVGNVHPTQISSGDAIAPAQPSLTTSEQQISRSASEPVSTADQKLADNNFAASDSASHSQLLPATTPEALQQVPSIQQAASTSDSSSTPEASQQVPSIQQAAASDSSSSDHSAQVNPNHQPLATTTASEATKTSSNKETDISPNPASHSSYSDQADTVINRKIVSSSTSKEPKATAGNSSVPTNINSIDEPTAIQRKSETSQANDHISPETQPFTAITPAPQNAVNRSADEQSTSVATPSIASESSEPKSLESEAQLNSSIQRSTETNSDPSSATRQERSFLQRYFSSDPKPSSSNSASADSPQPQPLDSSQALNNPPANEQPSNQPNPEITSTSKAEPIINRSVEQPNSLPIAESVKQSSLTNAEPHADQIQRQESSASSDIGSTEVRSHISSTQSSEHQGIPIQQQSLTDSTDVEVEVRSQPQHFIQRDTDTAATTPEPHIPSQIQQESENQLEQVNLSTELSATSDSQPSIQAQLKPRNILENNQIDRPNNQPARSAQTNLDQVKIQQQSAPENINRSSSVLEQYNSYSEADDTAKGQSIKENLEPTISTNKSVDSVQPKSDTTTNQSVDFTQAQTGISSHESVSQTQPQIPTNQPVKPIQKVGNAVNRLMRFFANQVNPSSTNQTNQLDQTAPAEVQQSESVKTSTTLSEDSRVEPSTLTSDLASNSGTQPIQRYSDYTSDQGQSENLNYPEDNVSSLPTESETTFSTKSIIESENLSSKTVRLKSDSEDLRIEQSLPLKNQIISSGSDTANLHEAAKPHVPDSATPNSTPDIQSKLEQTEAVDSDDFQPNLAKVSESPPNQQIQASITSSVTDSTTSSATSTSANSKAQSAPSTSNNQVAEVDTASSRLAAELQSQPSSSLRPDTIQRSEQAKIEAFTDSDSPTTPSTESETLSRSSSSNFIGQPDIGSAATSASLTNTPPNKASSHLADGTIQTKTDSTQPAPDLVSADAVNQAAQVKTSISEPTQSAEIQSADHVQRSSQAEEFSNAVDENPSSASAENMTSDDQSSAKDAIAPDLSSTLHTDTPHKQPLQRQIGDTSSVIAQADTHLQHDIHQSHQQNHSVEPSSSITLETTADSQPTNIQRASALSIEDAIASSATPTIPTPATPNETVQRFTDSNFTAPDEAAQSSHAIVSSLSEPSLDNPISADSSSVSPVVQQSSTDQNILNRNTDEITSTSELSAAQPVYGSSESSAIDEQQSLSNKASQEAPGSLLEEASGIQASHVTITQTPSSEQSNQEVQKAPFEGIPSIQASSTQTVESQTSEQPDIQLQQDSDLGSRSLLELENNLQRKSEPETTDTFETETTARSSVQPNTTPQPTAQTPSIQAQSTQVNSIQASSTQAVPEQLANLDFNQPSAQTPTVQAQSTQTDLEKATINHPEQAELIQTDPERVAVAHPEQAQSTQLPSVQAKFTQADSVEDLDQDQPSTQVPSVQAKREQADPEPTGSENLEPNQPAAAASSAQPSPTQPSPAQTPSIQAQTVQPGVEQADSEHVDLNQLSTPEPSVQAKSTQANLEQADSEGLALNQPSIPVPSVQAKPTQVNLGQASSEDLELNQPSTPESSVQAKPIHTDLEPAGSEQSVPLQPSTQMPSVQAKSTQVNSVQPSSTQAQSSQINSVQQPLVQAKSAQTNAEHEAASTTDQQVDQTPITVLRPIGILQSLTTTPISTTAIQSKASQDKQIQPQANTEANIQHQNVSLATGSYQDETSAGERLAGNSLPAHTAFSTSNLQRQIAATESVLNESIDAVQFQQTDHSYADQPESHQGLADIQRRPIDQGNQVNQINETNQINSSPNLIESSHSTSQAAEQDSNGMPTPDSIQRSIDYPTANQISTDQPNQPVINRSLADAVAPAANQQSIQPESLLDTSVNQTSGTWTTSETSHQPESHQPRAYNPSASPQVEHTVNPRTGQEAISTPSNLVQRASAEQADQEASTQPNPTSDQIQRSPSTEAHQTAEPLAEPVQPAAQQPDEIQRDQLADQQTDNSQSEAAAQSAQSLSQPQSLSQLPANSIQRNNQLDSPPPADSRPDTGIPTQWSSLADLVEQTQHLSTPTPTESAPGATSGLPNIQRQVDAADSETIQNLTVDVNVVRGAGESAIAPPPSPLPPPSPSSSIPTQWSSLENLVQQMPSLESSADTARQQAETTQPSQIQRKSLLQIQEKTPKASSALSSQTETQPKSRSTLQPIRQASKPRSTLSVSRVAPVRSSQSTLAPQTTVQAKFNSSRTNPGATLIQASEDEPFVTISRSGGSSEAAADYAEALELLAQAIYSLLRQRLAIEQERHGAGYPNRFR